MKLSSLRNPQYLRLYGSWFVRGLWPTRRVTRNVQGVDLVLPWAHRLPDYARSSPAYGQNLVQLAAAITQADGAPVSMLDVGANVGDSTLQVLNATDGTVLCVEGDAYYLDFLHANVDRDPRVVVEESLVVVPETVAATDSLVAVRSGGTTRFEEKGGDEGVATLSPAELRGKYPQFDGLRLVKSDTDGWDVVLVPALAREWAASRPVLFFEYDPRLSAKVENDATAVWAQLGDLGYDQVGIWDNGGALVGTSSIADIPARLAELEQAIATDTYQYWDVAVVHADDAAGLRALQAVTG